MRTSKYRPPAGVYLLYDKDELVYVGQTNDVYRRISEHSSGRVKPGQEIKQFSDWRYIDCDDEDLRTDIEYLLITLTNPKYNEDYCYRGRGEQHYLNDYDERRDHLVYPRDLRDCITTLAKLGTQNAINLLKMRTENAVNILEECEKRLYAYD